MTDNNNCIDSDTSEDEDLELLKQAIDSSLIQDSMYTKTDTTHVKETVVLKSCRRQNDEEGNQFNELKVTSEFRKYVGKHLERILEEWLKKHMVIGESNKRKRRKTVQGGVRLLSNSVEFVNIDENDTDAVTLHNKNAKRFKIKNDESDLDNLKSVVVNAKFILSGVETKHWTKTTNKKLFVYKKYKDNLLHFVQGPINNKC